MNRIILAWVAGLFLSCYVSADESSVLVSSAALAVSTAPVVADETFASPVGGAHPKVLSGYGKRMGLSPKPGVAGASEMHSGIDFRVQPGAAVHAAKSGKVLFAGFSKEYATRADKKQQSRFVIMKHPDGLSTRYVHLNSVRVRPGSDVAKGDVLGTAAESDEWKEPVLHFEIRSASGVPLNPAQYFEHVKSQ